QRSHTRVRVTSSSSSTSSALSRPFSVSEEPYLVDDVPWEDGGGWTHLYPSQQRFVRRDWWIPGESNKHYDYRVTPDVRVMCRLCHAMETGTKLGDAPFEERHYQDLNTVKDGVVIEQAVRFIREDTSRVAEDITELTRETEWQEL